MRITVSEKVFKEKNLEIGEVYANKQYVNEMYKKLAQLEDIEEELGIDLVILFKALKEGVWCKIEDDIPPLKQGIYHFAIGSNFIFSVFSNTFSIPVEGGCLTYNLKDYNKTWALTEEELL